MRIGDKVRLVAGSNLVEAQVKELLPNGRLKVVTTKVFTKGAPQNVFVVEPPYDVYQVAQELVDGE